MITEIHFPEELTAPLGLQPANLRDLKSLVVLAGPNGAGKSRFLKLMGNVSRAVTVAQKLVTERQTHPVLLFSSSDFDELFERFPKARADSPQYDSNEAQRITQLIKQTTHKPVNFIHLTYHLNIHTAEGSNPYEDPPKKVDIRIAANKEGGFESALHSVHSYFFEVARSLHNSKHPDLRDRELVKRAHADASSFNEVLKALLSIEIESALSDQGRPIAHVRGRPFDPKELSKGELVLAVWAILLHRQKEWLRGACILVDEPENHLHPDVCIKALTALQRDIIGPSGQIWLATHSIPLIAHAGMESVYFVDNGTIEYAGNKLDKVIDRLMGGPEGRTKLRTFLSDAEGIAFDVFAAQCLLPPTVASARENDSQQTQMVNIAATQGTLDTPLRILDFAAGRGRLAAALHQAGLQSRQPFTYSAYNDPRFSRREEVQECLQHLRKLGQPGKAEDYFVDSLEQLSGIGSAPMDLVVMCNVLHEIPVKNWQRCFFDIHEVLAPTGRLVILEDQLPNEGELPTENGYVILDELALRELFKSRDAVKPLHADPEARLTAFSITRPALVQVSSETLGKALQKVMRRAREQIQRLRAIPMSERTYQHGRKHAHFTLLYANTQLALEEYPARAS